MKIMLFCIILMSSSVFAIECDESQNVTPLPLSDLHEYANKLQENINWFSATDKDVDNALCVQNEDFSIKAIEDHFNSLGPEMVTREVAGVKVTDHPRKINLLRKLLRTNEFDPQIELSEDQKKCADVSCITKSLFGDLANEHLYLLDKYGLNLNSQRKNNTAKWNREEVSNLMNSLNYVPKQLLPFETNQTFVRGERDNPYGGTYANATIYFYDLHFTQTNQMQTYTIFHEIGHNMASELDLDESEEWKSLSDWKPNNKKDLDNKDIIDSYTKEPIVESWHANHNHKAVSKYAQTNPAEDFAETFSAYRFAPNKLKEIAPKKYEYMKKNVFHGIEYLDESLCQKENSYSYKNFVSKDIISLPNEVDDLSVCQESITALINKETYNKQVETCAKKLIAQESIKRNIKKNNPELSDQAISIALNSSKLPIENIKLSDTDLLNTKKLLASKVMKSLIKDFYSYSTCSDMKANLTQDLDLIGDKLSDFQYFYDNQDSLNNSLESICIQHMADKGFSCEETILELTSNERAIKSRLCEESLTKTIRCSDSLSRFPKYKQESFKKICRSSNLVAPDKMYCDDSLKKIFANLLDLPDGEHRSLKCD